VSLLNILLCWVSQTIGVLLVSPSSWPHRQWVNS
jgi:hypothetical protein